MSSDTEFEVNELMTDLPRFITRPESSDLKIEDLKLAALFDIVKRNYTDGNPTAHTDSAPIGRIENRLCGTSPEDRWHSSNGAPELRIERNVGCGAEPIW